MTESNTYNQIVALKRLVLGFFALLFVFNWWNGILPHQLANAPLFDVSLDLLAQCAAALTAIMGFQVYSSDYMGDLQDIKKGG